MCKGQECEFSYRVDECHYFTATIVRQGVSVNDLIRGLQDRTFILAGFGIWDVDVETEGKLPKYQVATITNETTASVKHSTKLLSEHCEQCKEIFQSDDIDGGRCIKCGHMITPPVVVNKITPGFVIQVLHDGQPVSQSFTAGDQVDYETVDGEPTEVPDNEGFCPFEMVQP